MASQIAWEGTLECGLPYSIAPSRKKSPGLAEGTHFIAAIKGCALSIPELPSGAFRELCDIAHKFAEANAVAPGAYRVAYNGPAAGRRTHAHIHILLPTGDDSLPQLTNSSAPA